jgi:peptidoglycan hydrolase-like protein with peptidoglycan-binding domain
MNRHTKIVVVVVALAATSTAVLAATLHHASAATVTGTNPSLTTAHVERTALVATEEVTGTLGYPPGRHVINQLAGIYTSIPDEGAIVRPGEVLFSVDSEPVILFAGAVPTWRAFTAGMADGPDVAELQAALVNDAGATASRVHVDGHYGPATIAAVRRWQQRLGLEVNGTIELGRVVFLPAAVRVGQHRASMGDLATPGQEPYATTAATRVVTIALDVARQVGVAVGVGVTVELPSGTRAQGRVFDVGRVAQTSADTTSGARPTITVTVALNDPTAAGNVDQLPVAVDITTATRNGVLAVPLTALLGLREGGFGIEVVNPDGHHHIVAVNTGLFTDSLVEVSSADVHEGMTVVTAQ